MSVVAVRGVSAGGLWTASALIHADTWLLALCLCHTAGFLLYDLADMVRARQRLGRSDGGPLVLLHHLFGILGVLIGVGHHNCAALYALFVFTEVSTPFLNNVFFAEMRGDAFLRTVNGVLLFLTYAPRVILPPAVASAVYKLWPEFRKVALAMRLYVLAMLAFATVMNYYWWYKIGRGCWKGLQGLSFLQMARLHKKSVEDERAAACTAGHGRANAAGRTAAVSNRVASSPN
ncbi:TLC domain-containing protein [Pelagophyceae sp. CCMP2097]|nr:TLC domain-containing protein [Pelagophyceae sp. CCMP2097]